MIGRKERSWIGMSCCFSILMESKLIKMHYNLLIDAINISSITSNHLLKNLTLIPKREYVTVDQELYLVVGHVTL